MEYGTLIRQAWAITWRYRFLWLLGVLAGGSVGIPNLNGGGGGSGWRPDSGSAPLTNPSLVAAGEQIGAWAMANIGLLVALAVAGAVLALVLLVVSFIAQGGMAMATADIARGVPTSLGTAWGAGVHLFWRYVGLWLLLIGAAIAIGAVFAAIVAAGALGVVVGQAPWVAIALAIIFVPVLIVTGLLLSIVVAFAQRAIAIEDVGPIDALRSGWQLTRTHLGTSLLTWLVNVGLALATGIAAILSVVGAVVILAALGGLVFAVAGMSGPLMVYIGLGGLVLLAGMLTLAGVANTFFWTFWTLAYLRLSGRTIAAPAI